MTKPSRLRSLLLAAAGVLAFGLVARAAMADDSCCDKGGDCCDQPTPCCGHDGGAPPTT